MVTAKFTYGEKFFMYYLFTFKSRSGAMKFAENAKKEGAVATVVGTPQSIGGGCGLSVKMWDGSVGRRVLYMGKYPSFSGLYTLDDRGHINILKK